MNKTTKIILFIIIAFTVLFIISAAVLPAWISTPTGTKTFLKWVNSSSQAKVQAEKIDLNWLGPQRFKNFQYEDKYGSIFLSVPSLESKTSLLYLLLGGRNLSKTVLESPTLIYKGKSLEQREKEQKEKTKRKKRSLSFTELIVNDGSVTLASNSTPLVTISEIFIKKHPSSQRLTLDAVTEQANVRGTIHLDAALEKKIEAKLSIKNFPIAILDHLFESNLYSEGLGPSLNADLEAQGEKGSSLTINGKVKSKHLTATLAGSTVQDKFVLHPQTKLDLAITPTFFKQLIDEKQRGEWELASKTNLVIEIEKGEFPLNLKKPYDFKNVILQASAKVNRAELHHATVGSYSLKQFDASVTSLNNLEIAFQGDIKGKEATKLTGNVSISPNKEILYDFTCEGFPTALLQLASTQLEKNVRYLLGSQFNMDGQGTYIEHEIDSRIEIRSPNTDGNVYLTGKFPALNFEASGTRRVHGPKARIIGESFNFTLKGIGDYKENNFSIPFLQGNAFNSYLEVDLRGQIGKEGEAFSFESLQLVSTGRIKKLPLEEELSQSALQNGTLFIQVDGSKNLITGKAESQAVEANFEIKEFIQDAEINFDKADITFSCNLSDFPVALVSPFISEEIDLTSFIGKQITVNSKGSFNTKNEPRFSMDVNAHGAGFATSLAIAIDGSLTVKQNRPSYIYWELTPERYNALMRLLRLNPEYEPTYTLTRPTQVELNITQFICPTTSSQNLGHFICQSGFVGDVKIGTTIFRSKKTKESIQFHSIHGVVKGENFSKALQLALSGNISAENIPDSEKAAFSFEGEMFNFWTAQGKFNREGLTVKGLLSLDLLPVRQFTGIVPLDPETRTIVQAVLGEFVNARIYGEISQMAGPLTVDMKSSNFKAKLPLYLNKNVVQLRDAADMEITLTNAVNETLLKDITPLFITGAFSEHPIKVRIDPQGFLLPLKPYSISNVQIGKAVIDIGRIRVRNGGQIQSMMQFLNIKEVTSDGIMEAWFTPIYMSLQNGIASYRRFDALLAGSVHIAMWGNINLVNGNVNMILGIAPSTLYHRFKISGLSKTELFQVKMRGTTSNLELDWSSAQTRISFIVARSATGPIGAIIGGVLEQIVPKFGEEPSPPPTTEPFPWENIYPSEPKRS